MEYTAAPSPLSPAPAEAASTARWEVRRACAVPEAVGKLVSATLTCIFAIVGSSVGAMAGALIGLATENGLLRGAGIGAISGAVFSVEVAESSFALLRSNGSGTWSVLLVMDTVLCLLSGRLVHEKIGPAAQSQVNVRDTPFQDVLDVFETGGTRGMSRESLDKIPEMTMSTGNNVDPSGERMGCSVCLQDFQVGEAVRSLPHCRHTFHLPCIDGWLIRRSSCPLCRRDF